MTQKKGQTMKKRKQTKSEHEGMIILEGFDDCIIGTCEKLGQEQVFAYDKNQIIRKMITRDGMEYEDAVDFFEFNIIGAYLGETAPCFIDRENK